MRIKRGFFLGLVVLLVIGAVCLVLLERRMHAVRDELAAFTAKNQAAGAILNGVEETIRQAQLYYADIVTITRDAEGNITSLETDTARLNTVSNAVNRNVDAHINTIKSYPVRFPLSSLSGDEFLSGIGPDVTFYVTLTGTTSTTFANTFDAAGMNQTRHRIVLEIEVSAYVIFGGSVTRHTVRNEVCIAENIIVGITPDAVAQLAE